MKKLCTFPVILLLCAGSICAAPPSAAEQNEASQPGPQPVLPGDWAPELLFGILSSPSPQAGEALYRATFAAGPAIIPQLQAALKDDRTEDFAAQSLAYIGGPDALKILSGLASDPRDLDLRRFYFGALGEFNDSRATNILLDAVRNSDHESDRTVTETAIIALTVHSDQALVPELREIEKQIKDVVIQDDLENAADVIEARAQYLSTPAGKKAGDSVAQAVRTYFIPALEGPPDSLSASASEHQKGKPDKPAVDVRVENLVFSQGGARALAHVVFETPQAQANYEIVLQKKYGSWTLASVWLGAEEKKR